MYKDGGDRDDGGSCGSFVFESVELCQYLKMQACLTISEYPFTRGIGVVTVYAASGYALEFTVELQEGLERTNNSLDILWVTYDSNYNSSIANCLSRRAATNCPITLPHYSSNSTYLGDNDKLFSRKLDCKNKNYRQYTCTLAQYRGHSTTYRSKIPKLFPRQSIDHLFIFRID